MRLSVVILAGGQSSRFNGNKLLARLPGGQRMLSRVIAQCMPVANNVTVISGAYHNALAAHIPDNVDVVFNKNWAQGLSSSLAAGVSHVEYRYPESTHLLAMLGDLPAVTTHTLSVLRDVATIEPEKMIASYWDGHCSAPAVFPRQYWRELSRLSGDSGAGGLLHQGMYHTPPQTYAVPHPEAAFDIDTVAALKNV